MAEETPRYGLPYPEPIDAVDVPYFQHALANEIERTLTQRFQHGAVSVVGGASADVLVTIYFDPPFATPPTVVASPAGANSQSGQGWAWVTVEDPTTTQAVLCFRSNDGDVAFNYRIEWFATDL